MLIALAVIFYYLASLLSLLKFEQNYECRDNFYYSRTILGTLIGCLRFSSVFILSFCIDYFFYFGIDASRGITFRNVGNIVIEASRSFQDNTKTDFIKNEYIY